MDFLFSLLQMVGATVEALPEPLRSRVLGVVLILVFILGTGSALCSLLNARVRAAQEAGIKVPPGLLKASAIANVLGGNLDKAAQNLRGGRGPSLAPGAPPVQK